MRLYVPSFAFLLLASGCAGVPEQTFDVEQHALTSISVATPHYDDELLLRYRRDQLETVDAISPVPIGRLFAYVATENREAEFTLSATTPIDELEKNFRTQLKQQLEENNYTVVTTFEAPNEASSRDRNGLLKSIPTAAFGGSDAFLETSGEIGFTAAGRGKPFEATLWVTVRLTAPDGQVLLRDQILYNPPETEARGLLLYPTSGYTFDNEEAILNSFDTSKALEHATRAVAQELLLILKGPVQHVR